MPARTSQPELAQQTEVAALRAENQRLRAVLDAVAQTNATLDTDVALDAILDAAQQVFGADRCLILLASPHSNHRSVRRSRGLSAAYRRHLTTGHVAVQKLLEQGQVLNVYDLLTDSPVPLSDEVLELVRGEGIRGCAAFGLWDGDHGIGALVLYFNQPHRLSPGELELADIFARQAARSLVHAQDFELLDQMRALRAQSEQRLQAILDRIRDLVIVWNPEMEILVANANAQRFLKEMGADEDPSRLGECLPPPGNCPVHQVFRDGQSVVGCEVGIGESVYAVDCHPLHDSSTGELLAVVQHARDITAQHLLQKELAYREEHVRQAMEMAPVGIVQLGVPDGEVLRANRLMGHWCEHNPDDMIGHSFAQCLPEDERERFSETWREVIATGSSYLEVVHFGPPDNRVPVSLTLGRLQYTNGDQQVQCIVKDIRRRQRLQAQLIEQEKLAAIGQLASGVAHELRNPINIIGGALFDLDEILESDDPDVQEDLSIARDEILRVQEIINNVLDFARGNSVERDWVDLGALLKQTVALLRKSVAARDVELHLDLGDAPAVWANPSAMRQVALNLITNSYQATSDGGRIGIQLEPAGPERVRFSISDTGSGIPKDQLSHIFNPFFTTKAPGQGTGLGLSIVYSTIREHGGTIEVDSEPGHGTTFRIELPRRAEAQAAENVTPLVAAADELL